LPTLRDIFENIFVSSLTQGLISIEYRFIWLDRDQHLTTSHLYKKFVCRCLGKNSGIFLSSASDKNLGVLSTTSTVLVLYSSKVQYCRASGLTTENGTNTRYEFTTTVATVLYYSYSSIVCHVYSR
jgi:hypothetical protein